MATLAKKILHRKNPKVRIPAIVSEDGILGASISPPTSAGTTCTWLVVGTENVGKTGSCCAHVQP